MIPPPMGLESTLIDDAIVTTFHCKDKAVWTHGFKKCASLDPAYGGGDKKILTFINYGETEDENGKKRWVIEEKESIDVPIDVESSRPVHYQIVDFCKVECQKRGIGPTQFSTLTAGEGGGLHAIFIQEWGQVTGIEEGGSPSDIQMMDSFNPDGTPKTAKQTYDTRASELLFQVRDFALADGIRGLGNDSVFQACHLRTFYRNGKWCTEPKVGSKSRVDEQGKPVRGYKQRMGHSYDHLDSFKTGVEFCRLQGAVPTVMGKAITQEQEIPYRHQQDEYSEENYLQTYSFN